MPYYFCMNFSLIHRFFVFLFGLFFGFTSLVKAQSPHTLAGLNPQKSLTQYQLQHWQKNKGLQANNINSIVQSTLGYIWLGSTDGLIRFDGQNFRTYLPSNTPALLSREITCLLATPDGALWIGTQGGGLLRHEAGKFEVWGPGKGLPSNHITALVLDKTGSLWIGTTKGLAKFQDNKLEVFSVRDGLSAQEITSLYFSRHTGLWIGTQRGLTLFKEEQFMDYSRQKILFINKYISSIAEDTLGNTWIGTPDGLVRWNEFEEQYEVFFPEYSISDLCTDSYGSLWFSTQIHGLFRIKETDLDKSPPHFEVLGVGKGLPGNGILALFPGTEGGLWLGFHRSGLVRLEDGKFTNFGLLEGLPDQVVNCVYQEDSSGIWAGTLSGGAIYLYEDEIRVVDKSQGLASNCVRSILRDQEGSLWVATCYDGISRLQVDAQNRVIRSEKIGLQDGLAGDIIRALYQTRDGRILIATRTGLSVYKNGRFNSITRAMGLSDNNITCILEDSQGTIWLGTENRGLNALGPDNSIIVYQASNQLADDRILSLSEDSKGSIWVGTANGLSWIHQGDVETIRSSDGLPSDQIYGILVDQEGSIWFTSPQGLWQCNLEQLKQYYRALRGEDSEVFPPNFYHYDEADGMRNSDCASSGHPSILMDSQSQLWLPTIQGVSRFNPKNMKLNLKGPNVVIQNIRLNNQDYLPQDVPKVLSGNARVEFSFAALSYVAPGRIRYRYRLNSPAYQEEWVEAGAIRKAFYTNLPPGKYTFTVEAANLDGVWKREAARFDFYLKPYFYQTYWFYVVSVFFLLLLVYLFYYWRVSSLQKTKEALEKGIEQSTQKIREQYKEITQQAEELQSVNNIVRVVNQELEFKKVMKALLEQGLSLFSESDQGVFLVYNSSKNEFDLFSSSNYPDTMFDTRCFSPETVTRYCEEGQELAEDIFFLRPRETQKYLCEGYRPDASVAMQITIDETIEGILLFDHMGDYPEPASDEIAKLDRFQEHAQSAFAKARILGELEAKNGQLESSYRKISDSIRYASRIQNAILPSPEDLSDHFPNHFVIYRSKDIVSGDFYWIAETAPEPIFALESTGGGRTSVFKGFNDIKTVVAAVDCTGHGVPGAFMTVIGNDLLNSIVIEEKINRAHRILEQLDRNVRKYLKQEEGSKSRDGMDMALVVIDETKREIEFAGAHNPLYLVRQGVLHPYKADKISIGGVKKKNNSFRSHVIEYEPGDMVYMFSDGFQDQFGGPQDRKFSSKRLRETILLYSHLPLSEQKIALEKTLDNWQGNKSQTDDILVLGIQLW